MKKIFLFTLLFSFALSAEENSFIQLFKEKFSTKFFIDSVDKKEIALQEKEFSSTCSISINEAFIKAVDSFVSDDDDSESLLSIVTEIIEQSDSEDIKSELQRIINSNENEFSLLSIEDHKNAHDSLPPFGEHIENAWIFSLNLPLLSDHTFWAIVTRDGKKTYNYGIN